MALIDVTDQTFAADVEGGALVLVDFWAPWCGPCRMIAPVLAELAVELGDEVTIAKLNVDDNPEMSRKYGVMSIPTMILFKDGEPVDKVVGFVPKDELKATIKRHQ